MKNYFENTIEPKPKHGSEGEYREFVGKWDSNLTYSGDRFGHDVYCAKCNNWNTVENTSILFKFMSCKNCGTSFLDKTLC